MSERIISLHANQRRRLGERRGKSYILLSEQEAEKLENALRLARTGKLGVERAVPTKTPCPAREGVNPIVSTRFTIKSYIP
jgi:hypothetical protein